MVGVWIKFKYWIFGKIEFWELNVIGKGFGRGEVVVVGEVVFDCLEF